MNTELHSAPLSNHLTEAEFGELLAGSVRSGDSALTPAEVHVLHCKECAAELEGLRESLALFREATTSYADGQLRRMPAIVAPGRPLVSPVLRCMVLATAAALVLAAFLPMQMLHQKKQIRRQAVVANSATSFEHYATESNEALLNDVDQAASASVPEAMQSLADPAATNNLSSRKSN